MGEGLRLALKGFRFLTLGFGFSGLRFVVCDFNIRTGIIFRGQKLTEGSRVSQY